MRVPAYILPLLPFPCASYLGVGVGGVLALGYQSGVFLSLANFCLAEKSHRFDGIGNFFSYSSWVSFTSQAHLISIHSMPHKTEEKFVSPQKFLLTSFRSTRSSESNLHNRENSKPQSYMFRQMRFHAPADLPKSLSP